MKISPAAVATICCLGATSCVPSSAFAPSAASRSTATCVRRGSSNARALSDASGANNADDGTIISSSRRDVLLSSFSAAAALTIGGAQAATADAAAVQDSVDIDSFLRSGVDVGGNMGVSSQAGKSRPQTGVVLRDGSDVRQDGGGNVSAEVLTGTKAAPSAVLVSFASPWKLETGSVFDVETRDKKTGDGAFLAVTKSTGGASLSDLPSPFFLERLFDPTGRFSFYGPPTDVKIKSSKVEGDRRYIELSFSNLSQSTNAEIPRKALLVATIPSGTDNAVMLVASSNAARWKKGSEKAVRDTVDSFRAIPAPKSSMKMRAKNRGAPPIDF